MSRFGYDIPNGLLYPIWAIGSNLIFFFRSGQVYECRLQTPIDTSCTWAIHGLSSFVKCKFHFLVTKIYHAKKYKA